MCKTFETDADIHTNENENYSDNKASVVWVERPNPNGKRGS